jgi:hypothetical protein
LARVEPLQHVEGADAWDWFDGSQWAKPARRFSGDFRV